MSQIVKTLENAVAAASTLPEADQEEIGRQLLSHIEKLRLLRQEIDKGIRSLEAGEGKPLDIDEFLAENGSGDCPTTPEVWRKLEVSPKRFALRRQKPQSPSCRCVWRSAFLILIMLCGIREPNDGDCTYWPRTASFLSFKSSRRRSRLAFGGIRRRHLRESNATR